MIRFLTKIPEAPLKQNASFFNSWIRNGLFLIVFSIIINHFTEPENFPFNRNYEFPLTPIIASVIGGAIAILIASLNFKYFRKKYFIKKINSKILLRFLFSTLGYITLVYVPFYYVSNYLVNGSINYNFYYLLNGLLVSLLIDTIIIAFLFSSDIYKLHKFISTKGTLKVKQSGKITLVKLQEIFLIYSENKIVYIVKIDGTKVITDFTLNEIENRLSKENFFRANRQAILQQQSIEQVQSIENGKLLILLKRVIPNKDTFQINISRYKKQAFMNWFEKGI